MTTRRLPLFPLHTVLFPGTGLPLHIFEERYKAMVAECLEGDRLFGVCLIRSGSEVGEPAEPYLVGTEAEILSVRRLADGRLNLLAVGKRRIRVVEITQWRPWVAGEVRILEETETAGTTPLARRLREEMIDTVQRAFEGIGAARDPSSRPAVSLPRDPVAFSFAAAAMLPQHAVTRQELLEESSTRRRLERIGKHLQVARAEQEAEARLRQAVAGNGGFEARGGGAVGRN